MGAKDMKDKTRIIIGWICFVISSVIYLIVTCCFGVEFAKAIADYNSGEALELAALLIIFLLFGSIAYAVNIIVSVIGAIVANVKRGERKFFFAPIIPFVFSILTWIIFILVAFLR